MKEREESSDALSKQVSELTEKLRDSVSRLIFMKDQEVRIDISASPDKERDTEVLRHSLDDTREQVAEKDQRIQQLEEQVASNVNAAELEQKLIAKSDHADSLEVEVSRQRQAEGKLRGEKESLETKLQQVQTDLGQLRRDLSEAKEQGNEKEMVLVTVRGELEALKKEKESLEAKAKEVVGLTQANEEFAKKLESATAGLSTAETERASAEKRADAAEQRKRDLQKDNQDLISRLDELQTSYVEATNGRAALEMELEKSRTELKRSQQATEADSKTLAEQDKTLQQKEASIKTLTEQLERVSRELEYAQDESKAKVTELETELKDLQQRKSGVQGEIERYKMGAEARIKEIADLKGVLEGVKEELSKAASEKEEAVKAHSELSKELESLRTSTQAPSSHGAPLDREYVDSIQQQHELDLSTARTQIRTLENRVFEEESHCHELLKRVGEYQDQVRGLEESLRTERDRSKNLGDSVSPSSAANPAGTPLMLSSNHLSPTPSPSSGRSPRPSPSHRRSASHLPTLTESLEPSQRSYFPVEARASPSPRPPIPDDVPSLRQARAVPPSARHARKVSLSMLKTRMEDELGVPDLNLPSQRQDLGFITPPPLSSSRTSEFPLTSTNRAPSRRIQHDPIFCSSCRGDMVVI